MIYSSRPTAPLILGRLTLAFRGLFALITKPHRLQVSEHDGMVAGSLVRRGDLDNKSKSKVMSELPEPALSDQSIVSILANTTMFDYRVESVKSGEFCVYAGPFPIKNYPSEDQAMALFDQLIDQRTQKSLYAAW
jgi:hypothetical protein